MTFLGPQLNGVTTFFDPRLFSTPDLKSLNRIFSVERFLILPKNYETFPFEVYENIFPLVFYSHVKIGGFF